MNKKLSRALILLSLLIAGCGVTNRWTYPPDDGGMRALYTKPRLPLKVAVIPFKEMRKNKNRDWLFLQYFPLAPYGWVSSDRPETSRTFMTIDAYYVNPPEDFARAVARSLQDANIFRKVYFSREEEPEKADLILGGEIYSTYYEGKVLTYCLSIVGKVFYLIGFPDTVSTNELGLKLYLINPRTDDKIWEHTFKRSWWTAQGFYYNSGADITGYPVIMQDGLKEAIYNLDKKMDVISWEDRKPDYEKETDRGKNVKGRGKH